MPPGPAWTVMPLPLHPLPRARGSRGVVVRQLKSSRELAELMELGQIRTLMGGLIMQIIGSLGFAVFTVVNLILFVVVLSGMFHRN
jgi:hypothetical protein